ncbi:MAG TPA: hypothetical protein VNL13_09080 [Sulfolobales archaeon]|nr:hypothetical protein [Sulfolobales archaeon]
MTGAKLWRGAVGIDHSEHVEAEEAEERAVDTKIPTAIEPGSPGVCSNPIYRVEQTG